jgi:predicted RNA-binding protein
MANWIFTVKKQKKDGSVLTGREIYDKRMRDCFWGLHDRTPNRKYLAPGDRIVFYIGAPESVFSGTATLTTPSFELSSEQKQKYSRESPIFRPDFGVELKDIKVWDNSKLASNIVSDLTFIENKEYWGTYFQGGIRGLSEEDYSIIVGAKTFSELSDKKITPIAEVESASQFALESHLEEFLHKNWDRIGRIKNLNLYQSEESDGRQYPAGTWSIDFLAVEKTTGDLVVIELKRGQTSDSTVGQVLRYIGWVKENVAEQNQNVKGLIICKQLDDALKYAVKEIPFISVLIYQVNFSLSKVEI